MTYDALLVVSFGGPEGPEDVRPFLENVTRGRGVPPARLDEVARHYERFGGVSPINAANRALIAALRPHLDLPVYWGNRNWHPLLADTVRRMADDGVGRALCFVTSAYGGYSSCAQYLDNIAAARAEVGDRAPEIEKLRHFYDHPVFIDAFASAAAAALAGAGPLARLVFSAHSVPVAQAGEYEPQVREAAELVASRVGGRPFSLAWQSRSGPPSVPWLGPDVADHLVALAAEGVRAAALVPIGFVADHLEVVYDLDVEAAGRAAAAGLEIHRAATPGTALVPMIVELVAERVAGAPPRRLGRLPAPSCCS